MDLVILNTGTANLASVVAAFERLGAHPRIVSEPASVATARRVVIPGVGTFAAGMKSLGDAGLIEPLRRRLAEGAPTFGVCLGLQLMCATSDESPGVTGLGVVDASVTGLDPRWRVPQMGWNRVSGNGAAIVEGWAYFANSFALREAPAGWSASYADHGQQTFVAALQRGNVLACQFHPELSGAWGLELITRWMEEGAC